MTQQQGNVRSHQLGLCLLCGLPAAGKTTMARMLSQSLKKRRGWRCVLLSYDDLMPPEAFGQSKASSGQEAQQSLMSPWRLYRHELLLYLEHFLQTLMKGCTYSPPPNRTGTTWERFVCCLKEQGLISREGAASHRYTIDITPLSPIYFFLDDNFYYRSMRYEVYQLARQYCQVAVCLKRNSQRTQPLPEETIHVMGQKIEVPSPEKYPWEQHSIVLKSTEDVLEEKYVVSLQVFSLLSAALENPVKPLEDNTELKEMDRAICAASSLHQADQALRRMVSQTMKSAKEKKFNSHMMKSLAEELNKQKVEFLEELRHKSNEKNQCCPQNNKCDINVTSLFSQQVEDIFQKYLA